MRLLVLFVWWHSLRYTYFNHRSIIFNYFYRLTWSHYLDRNIMILHLRHLQRILMVKSMRLDNMLHFILPTINRHRFAGYSLHNLSSNIYYPSFLLNLVPTIDKIIVFDNMSASSWNVRLTDGTLGHWIIFIDEFEYVTSDHWLRMCKNYDPLSELWMCYKINELTQYLVVEVSSSV